MIDHCAVRVQSHLASARSGAQRPPMHRRAACFLLAAWCAGGCVIWAPETSPVDMVLAERPQHDIRVTRVASGERFIVYRPRMKGDTLTGYLRQPTAARSLHEQQAYDTSRVAMHVTDVTALEVRKIAPVRSGILVAGAVGVIVWARSFFKPAPYY